MPKVTLLGKVGSDYTILIKGGSYTFVAGKTVEVPVAVALEAAKKVDRKKKPRFRVDDLPNIVKFGSSQMVDEKVLIPQQKNADSPRQLRLGVWA